MEWPIKRSKISPGGRRQENLAKEESYLIGNSRVTIGNFTYGRENLRILEWGEGSNLIIGKFCSIANNVSIFLGGNHRIDLLTTYPFGFIYPDILGIQKTPGHPNSKGDVVIGNDVWIGSGVTILSGVKINDGAVIALNSTVTKDIGPYEVWGGNPGRLLKKRFPEAVIDSLTELQWWNSPIDEILSMRDDLLSEPDLTRLKYLIKNKKIGENQIV